MPQAKTQAGGKKARLLWHFLRGSKRLYLAAVLCSVCITFLDMLTPEDRVIFLRRYWFADRCRDIAERVGLTEKNISVRLTRIREKLRKYLIEREVLV